MNAALRASEFKSFFILAEADIDGRDLDRSAVRLAEALAIGDGVG